MGVEVALGAAALGAVAGGMGDTSTTSSTQSGYSHTKAAPQTEEEQKAEKIALGAVEGLDKRLKAIEASPALARLDGLLSELGAAPTAQRIEESSKLAQQLFEPQRVAQDQAFQEQNIAFANRAAQMGRSSTDPILAAKLAQEQVRQRTALSAQQNSFAAQEAMNAPGRNIQNILAGVGGASAQAIQNRQAVYSLGSDFANQLRQFRVQTGTTYSFGQSEGETRSGGGVKGAITGAIGGAAAGVGMGQAMGMFGGGAGAMAGGGMPMMAPAASYYGGVGGYGSAWNAPPPPAYGGLGGYNAPWR